MVLTVRLELRERQQLSWAFQCADSSRGLSSGIHDSFCSDNCMCHRHPRNFGDGRNDVGATSATKRLSPKPDAHLWWSRDGDVLVSIRQSGASGISVLDPSVAYDRLLSHLPGKLVSCHSRRWGFGGAAPLAPPHGGGPNVHR